MCMVVYANASGGAYPGHMVIGDEPTDDEPSYFGFRFEPDVLPPEFRPPARWRDYLFTHTVPGNIVDETAFVLSMWGGDGGNYYTKRAECEGRVVAVVPDVGAWRECALYSFNPDDYHSSARPCYNCVTWATGIGNEVVTGFLVPVRQGRVKEIVLQLRPVPASQGQSDG